MKNLWTLAICACMSLYSLCASAQQNAIPINQPDVNKPKQFDGLPERIAIDIQMINSLFDLTAGRNVSLNLSDAALFRFEGNVLSSVSKYNNTLKTVMIRSSNYPGARLYISKANDERGSAIYSGHILSPQHGDMYEIKNIDNQYFLIKKKINSVLAE